VSNRLLAHLNPGAEILGDRHSAAGALDCGPANACDAPALGGCGRRSAHRATQPAGSGGGRPLRLINSVGVLHHLREAKAPETVGPSGPAQAHVGAGITFSCHAKRVRWENPHRNPAGTAETWCVADASQSAGGAWAGNCSRFAQRNNRLPAITKQRWALDTSSGATSPTMYLHPQRDDYDLTGCFASSKARG